MCRRVHAVRHGTDRDLGKRPTIEERRESAPADFTVELAYRIDRAASADRKIGHVERLTSVLGIVAAQRQKVPEIDSEHVIGIASQKALDHCRIDAVEPGRNRSMGCKEIACFGNT